jgi:primary-amine oxidase
MRARLARWGFAAWVAMATAAGAHPLDPLNAAEIEAAVAALRAAGAADDATRFVAVDLVEPPKEAVLAGRGGPRRAHVVLRRGATMAEAEVDLATRRVDGPRAIADAQSGVLLAEWETAAKLTIAHPDWQAAMRKRGYTAFDSLFCAPLTVGWFDTAEERGRRLLRVPCYETKGARTTVHGRPIEGLFAIVDLGAGAFAPGQTYVALSRLTSLDGLYLTRPLRPSDIRVDEDVRRFMRGVWERQGAQMRVS